MKIFTIDEIKAFDEKVFKELLNMNVREDNARSAIFKVNSLYLKEMNKSDFIDYVSEISFESVMTGIPANTIEGALAKAFRETPVIYNEFKDEIASDTTSTPSDLRV